MRCSSEQTLFAELAPRPSFAHQTGGHRTTPEAVGHRREIPVWSFAGSVQSIELIELASERTNKGRWKECP